MGNKVAASYNAKVGREQNAENWYKKLGYGTKIDGGADAGIFGVEGLYKDVLVTSAEILALNATPKSLVAAPGASKFLLFKGAQFFLDYNSTAYDGVASGEDLEIRYTDGSGQLVATIETDPFITSTADATRYVYPVSTAAIIPVANAALVLRLSTGEIATGNSPLYVRIFYDIMPMSLSV